MAQRWFTTRWNVSCVRWGAGALLGLACSQQPEPVDASSLEPLSAEQAPPGEAEMVPPGGTATNEAWAPSEAAPPDGTSAAPADPLASEPPVTGPSAGSSSPTAEGSDSSGEKMVEFFEIGRGDRIADLGGVSGYSLAPVRRALGPTGIVYVRRPTAPPTDPSEGGLAANDLGKLVWMKTPDDAPFIPDATKLNAVTVLFSYPAINPASRKKFNAAVLRALAPGGLYIIAGHEPSSDTVPGTARQPSAVSDAAVRSDVQAAGFQFVEAADFVSSSASAADIAPTRYLLKFRKPK